MDTLDDRDLADEIALLGEVIAAVAMAARGLTDSEVDEVLGVAPAPDRATDDAPCVRATDDPPCVRATDDPPCDRATDHSAG